ncbi:WD40/YVTN/BNR-like repeat-containing protein [Paenibacillus sp. SAF-054]|uniref:WD40/YVTN/BNR-like repeat-containing protein n=1 Tax=Paenibacillus sp. SAF-054 TaxID=3436863 RepID=UPI003F7D5787
MRKKAFGWLVCLSLVLSLWVSPGTPARALGAYPELDEITLQQSPVSMGKGWKLDTTFSSNAPYSMIQGKNKEYIAVGPYGTVMKSANGVNWAALSKFGNYHLTTIAWDGTKYVMFGSNTEYEMDIYKKPSEGFVSPDGLTWKKISFNPKETIQNLEWGPGGFVAVGVKHIFTSRDGENWTTTYTLKNPYGADALKVVNGTYFVSSSSDGYVLVSKDGRSWSAKTYNKAANVRDMVWTGNRYIGVGNGVYTSTDGVSWKKLMTLPNGAGLETIVYGHNMYVATGYLYWGDEGIHSVAYTSKDGTTWKKVDLAHIQTRIYTLYPVKNGFAGIGSNDMQDRPDGTFSIYTADGKTWSYRMIGTATSGDFSALATNGKRTVAVGMYGSVVYTDDGKTWRSSNPFSYKGRLGRAHLFDVAWGANKFVAAGNGGIYYSADGSSWKQANVKFSDQYGGLRNITWAGKFFVASDQVYGTYTSKDGVNWTRIASVSGDWLTSMIYDGKRLLAAFRVHNYDTGRGTTKIMQTTDGVHWKLLKVLDLDEAFLAWNGNTYVAANQYNPTKLWISKDGTNWSKKTTNLQDDQDGFNFITSFDGSFYAMYQSYNEIAEDTEYDIYENYYTSKDGVQWSKVKLPDKHPGVNIFGTEMMEDGIKMYGKYIFVGTYGEIMYTNQL